MNEQETAMIMSILQAAYPSFYRNVSDYDAQAAINLWAKIFEDEPYKLVEAAVMQHISTDEKGYPPHMGAIKNAVYKLTAPEAGVSEMEAWALVKKAIRSASMSPASRLYQDGVLDPRTSAERNYEALPELLQRIIGSPNQLAAWAEVSDEDVETVVQSNFMRSYRARAQNERETALMPSSIRAAVDKLLEEKNHMKALETHEKLNEKAESLLGI